MQQELSQAVAAPLAATQRAAHQAVATAEATLTRGHEHRAMANDELAQRGPGRPPRGGAHPEQVTHAVDAARHEPQRLRAQRETVTQRLRAIGPASHVVDLERGGRRQGTRSAGESHEPSDTLRPRAPQEHLSQACLARREQAERVVPTRPAPSELVAGSGRQPVRQLDLTPPQSSAVPAPRMPSYDRVEGRNGSRALRHHPRRGRDHPRKRAWLTAMHHCFLTRADGTTAAERLFEPPPGSMCAAILASVEIPPAPLSPPRRAVE